MRRFWLLVFFAGSLLAQPRVESQVLSKIQEMIREEGRITFSDLYNNPEFASDEQDFLRRLYEVFFAIPGYLNTEYEATGEIPSLEETASSFGLSVNSVRLLLNVMETDPRVPPLFDRDSSGEISKLNIERIKQFIERRGSQVRMASWAGEEMPDFSVRTLEGTTLNREALAGRNLVLYFWFTGCPPCVRQAPILANLYEKYSSAELEFVGFNADELLKINTSADSRKAYVEKQGLDFTHATLNQDTQEAFGGINGYPTLFLVSADGTIFRHMINFQEQVVLEEAIQELLGLLEP